MHTNKTNIVYFQCKQGNKTLFENCGAFLVAFTNPRSANGLSEPNTFPCLVLISIQNKKKS